MNGPESRTDRLAEPQAVSKVPSSRQKGLATRAKELNLPGKVRCRFLESLGLGDLSVSGTGLQASSAPFSNCADELNG